MRETRLPRFDSVLCAKCGHDGASVRWCAGAADGVSACPWEGQHMHRTCARCGYAWREAVRDASVGAADRQCGVAACTRREPCVAVALPSGTVWLCDQHGVEFGHRYRRQEEGA